MASHKEFTIKSINCQLFCRQFGDQGPPTIVVHGGPGLGQDYLLPQMAALGEFSTAIFYDQRGSGKSSADTDWYEYPFHTYAEDLRVLIESLGYEKVNLLSHSWGSMLSTVYALSFPQQIDKLIYINPVPVSTEKFLKSVQHRDQILKADKNKLDAIRQTEDFAQGEPKIMEQYFHILFKNYFFNPELIQQLSLKMSPKAAINSINIYQLFHQYLENNHFDLNGNLATLNKPTMIITGAQDIVPVDYQRELHHSIPGSEFIALKNCGHFPYIEQKEQFFKILRSFI